ncbi:MAG: hypothetical protein FJ151_03735 [Euryarchaeota archaeon]|nr:hypothetical protein [Euryarchaeota archaeon]
MIPEHCKDVSVRDVTFPLTRERIEKEAKGKEAYTRTKYIILRNAADHAIIAVEKGEGADLFRPIGKVSVLALPENTVHVRDETMDVLNRSQMAKLSLKHSGKTVVVSGMFNHVSFVKDEIPTALRVMDVIPPAPSKLSVLVDKAIDAELIGFPIVTEMENIDLNELALTVRTPGIVFPCRASGLNSERIVHYLDETPQIDVESTLIGCDLSRRIFRSRYGTPIESVDMCPRELAPKDGLPRIVKCCKIKEGFVLDGATAVVPWGATVREVADAVNALARKNGA